MSRVNIDWNAIRPLNGARANGFEELCAQLARDETPGASQFIRKGIPDAGVECYAILADGSEWGWQSKYFDHIGDSQWSQIDDSVRTVLDKHPKLARYFICIPLDLADGRIPGRKSARERWNDYVAKWTELASTRGMKVEFVYWGSHEMLERLAQPHQVGRVRFWFDIRGFDGAWFSARLDESLQTAGPRYTPEIHVDLPIARELDAFGRTPDFFDTIKATAKELRTRLRNFENERSGRGIHAITLNEVYAAAAAVIDAVEEVLAGFSQVQPTPFGSLPFAALAETVLAAERVTHALEELLERQRVSPADGANHTTSAPVQEHMKTLRSRLYALAAELRSTRARLTYADRAATNKLLVLRGSAGSGKTHLLCDVARRRIESGRPTVLLMGQRFVSSDAPWTQALQQLDLPGLSAEEFVGALEAAAEAADSRALVLIDAINEGTGRTLWPNHLAAFLAQLERSQWVGVVLSIRTSYEEIVIPEEIRTPAFTITHDGFADHEYDATRTFFIHYGLELPSTPLLAPEFRNPLFLKTLCRGLNAKGQPRLPRGFQGITAVFDLYLEAVNGRVAPIVGFNPKIPLVKQALELVSEALLDSGERWLSLTAAEILVNSLVTGRDFEKSLYRALVVEGLLIEEAVWREEGTREEVVFIAYERFADHLAARTLLDRHFDANNPTAAFAAGGPLSFFTDNEQYIAPGLLEAMCIQIPERAGEEFPSLAPGVVDRWGLPEAFRQSIIWRAIPAFSDSTRAVLNELCDTEEDLRDTLDSLLTVATIPAHPLNAEFLDARLRKDTMPERDRWWSVYLHNAWNNRGAVDRLVDWAFLVGHETPVDEEALHLGGLALGWMLTTPNRFLRDRATTALVNLLTGRMSAVERLVEDFSEVDDPYVVERVYAVAYGTAMRCHEARTVGALAERVYARIFSSGSPPAHILLRDYARGVIERALYLRAPIQVDPNLVRPPYRSTWPEIPSEEDIKPFLPDWSQGSYDDGTLDWARNRIGSSVLSDDFARYVIGTNSSSISRHWLSLRLDEPAWTVPESIEAQLNRLISEFSADERAAWETYQAFDNELHDPIRVFLASWLDKRAESSSPKDEDVSDNAVAKAIANAFPLEIAELEMKREKALDALDCVLTPEHAEKLDTFLAAKAGGLVVKRPPGFDLHAIQRYILKRVFDLGWTVELFGEFDRFTVGYHGREASKPERIGKKYQWIAYHEINAFLSDHFQYHEAFTDSEGGEVYEGPWQLGLRDIDPSCTMRTLRGGTAWVGHSTSWWSPTPYNHWGAPADPAEWVIRLDDLPNVADLLIVTDPADASRWVNANTYLNWQQQPPVDRERSEVERRELWFIGTGYLLRREDSQAFLDWAEKVDFWGRWMPGAPQFYEMFLGEHGWAPASRHFQHQYFGDEGWTQPGQNCPVKVRTVAHEYLHEAQGFDCSIDDSYRLTVPVVEFLHGIPLRWFGKGADYLSSAGQLAAFDPTVYTEGPDALLLREDILRDFLEREHLTICWAVVGEKWILTPDSDTRHEHPALQMSGAYVLEDAGVAGFLKIMRRNYKAEGPCGQFELLSVIRS